MACAAVHTVLVLWDVPEWVQTLSRAPVVSRVTLACLSGEGVTHSVSVLFSGLYWIGSCRQMVMPFIHVAFLKTEDPSGGEL